MEDNPTVTGQFPSNYVHPLARCVYEFFPAQEGDLAMAPDDIVLVTENASEWWRGTNTGNPEAGEGSFPANYVEYLAE